MSAPSYSPTSGVGTTSTDSSGTTYRFNGTGWTQISSGGGNNSSSTSDKQIGGWYNNNGQNMRYWGDKGWTTGADPGGSSSGGSSGATGADAILNSAVDSYASLVQKVPDYATVNPFAFDEALAKEAATAEYAPYYKELVTDYTSNVERTKSRSAEDLKTTLEQLNSGKEYYSGVQRRALDTATRNTNEGYAGNGLFFSGVRERDVKQLQTENQAQVGNYMDTYKYNVGQAQTGNTRTNENQDTALSQYVRDQGRAEKTAIAGNVLDRKTEALNEYSIKQQNYYNNAYGTYA